MRALEQEMRAGPARQGLEIEPAIVVLTRLLPEADGTTCDQRLEVINGTSGCRILRVQNRYTWRLYAQRMMTYARIYGFWRYVSELERMEPAATWRRSTPCCCGPAPRRC